MSLTYSRWLSLQNSAGGLRLKEDSRIVEKAMLYLGAEPERCPPHRRGVSDRLGGRQPTGRGVFVMVTGQFVSRWPRSLPVSRRVARKDFRRRQVIVQDGGTGKCLFAAVGVPLQHTQLAVSASATEAEQRLAHGQVVSTERRR